VSGTAQIQKHNSTGGPACETGFMNGTRGHQSPFILLCIAMAAAITASVHALGPTWPQWRGDGLGVSTDDALPTTWSATDHVRWKTAIPGRAHSSPIVWRDRVFLTTAIEGAEIPNHQPLKHFIEGQEWRSPDAVGGNRRHTFQVMSLDAATGRILWTRTAYEGPVYDDRHRRSSYAAPTPVTDGTRVYAYFGTEGIYAYRTDGTLVWKATPGKVAGLSVGVSSSPVLFRNLLIVQADEDSGDSSFLAAFDTATGKPVWRVERKKMSLSWATPILATTPRGTQLVTTTTEWIVSYDPATGRELWREKGLDSYAVPSPVVAGNLVIVSTGNPLKKTIALKLDAAPGESRRAWEYAKGQAYVVSPIAYDGLLYLSSDAGLLTCLDVNTGEVKYEGGRPPVPSTFMSSPVAFGGRIFQTSEDGDTFVIKAGPSHAVERTNSLGEPVFASFALANGTIYIRGERHLYAIR
jgi:outer membrane protein assembly factor BamB